MVKRIVKRFQPKQVILFGSHARGDAGPDSDVDLLVVMDFEGSARDKSPRLHKHCESHSRLGPFRTAVIRAETLRCIS